MQNNFKKKYFNVIMVFFTYDFLQITVKGDPSV
jgi:hypothetical protein